MRAIVCAHLYTFSHKYQLIAQVRSPATKQYNENGIIAIRLYWDSEVSVVTKH